MIPIYNLIDKNEGTIRIVKLDALTHYDTTKPHRHNYFELFIFERGEGSHQIDFHAFPIRSNSVHIVAPEQVHQVRRELNTNGFVILFDPVILQDHAPVADFLFDHMCLDVGEFHPVYEFEEEIGKQIVTSASMLWEDQLSGKALRKEFMQHHLSLICIFCMRTLKGETTGGMQSDTYSAFRRLLRSNFKEIKKVKDYAMALNVTEKKLNELVNLKTGLSCSALIYRQLILEAKRLLNTNISAKEVAYALNFDDPAHFSKFFKSQTGVSPSQFQKVQS